MPRRSLILITVDCLRADHVGFHGYKGGTTPFLDSLAGESFTFENAIVAGAPTYYSFPGIMASRHPLNLGRDLVGLAPGEATLATLLNDSGFRTGAFLGGNPYLSEKFGYHEGFDIFRDSLDADVASDSKPTRQNGLRTRLNRMLETVSRQLGPLGSVYDELYFQYCQRTAPHQSLDGLRRFPSADVLVAQALAWIESVRENPFFLWVHFMDPHSPYYPVQGSLEIMGKDMGAERARYVNASWTRTEVSARRLSKYRGDIVALYDAGIRWVDMQVERLAEALRQRGIWQDCVFALTADHGEELLDHGGRFHPPSKVTEELIRVPLLIRFPECPGHCVDSVFSLMDLAPTLLDSLRVPVSDSFCGSSRWKSLRDRRVWEANAIVECALCTNPFRTDSRTGGRILAVRGKRFKLIIDFVNAREQLFDLESDPFEKTPLSGDVHADVRLELMKRARQHLAKSVGVSRDRKERLSAQLRELRQSLRQPAGETRA